MKQKLKTIGRALCLTAGMGAACLLAACSEELTALMGRSGSEVEVNVSFADADKSLTRAADGLDNSTSGFSLLTATNSSSKVKVMVDQNDGSYTGYDYSISAATTIAPVSSAPAFPSGVSTVNVYGWYPNASLADFSVQADQSTTAGYCLSDLMVANGTTCERNLSTGAITQAAELSFTHVMSKVKVSLTLATGVTVKAVTLKSLLPQVDVTEQKTSNAVTGYSLGEAEGSATDIALHKSTDANITSASASAAKLLCGVFPPQSKNGAFLEITASYDSGSDQVITYTFSSAKNFTEGNEYVMNISLDGTNVTTGSVDISDWNTAAGTVNIGGGGGGTLTLDNTSVNLTYGGSNGTVNVTEDGVSTCSASSADASIATVSTSGTAVTITPVAAGSTQVLVYGTKAGSMLSSVVNVTVAKAAQTVTLSDDELSIGGVGNTGTFTVIRLGDGNITATSSNESIATTSVNQASGVVTVRNVAVGSATITVTLAEGTNYNAYTAQDKTVSVTTTALDIRDNPLWWVAQYNVQASGTFATKHSQKNPTNSSANAPIWTYSDAKTIGNSFSGQSYHQPDLWEQASVMPTNSSTAAGTNIWSLTNAAGSPYEFPEIARKVGTRGTVDAATGANVAASTSVIYKAGEKDYYAIRFIGTKYASAWHYKWISSVTIGGETMAGELIESYLVDASTLDAAKTLLTSIATAGVFTGTPESNAANQTPDSTTPTTNGFCQRFLPACGFKYSGSGAADSRVGADCYFWSSTSSSTSAFYWGVYTTHGRLLEYLDTQSYGFSVRLFRDAE